MSSKCQKVGIYADWPVAASEGRADASALVRIVDDDAWPARLMPARGFGSTWNIVRVGFSARGG
jgi:hypothetical protein